MEISCNCSRNRSHNVGVRMKSDTSGDDECIHEETIKHPDFPDDIRRCKDCGRVLFSADLLLFLRQRLRHNIPLRKSKILRFEARAIRRAG